MTDSLKSIGRKVYSPPEFYDYLEHIREKPLHIKFKEKLLAIIAGISIAVLWVVLMGLVVFLLVGFK